MQGGEVATFYRKCKSGGVGRFWWVGQIRGTRCPAKFGQGKVCGGRVIRNFSGKL